MFKISPELKLMLLDETMVKVESHMETVDYNFRGRVFKMPGMSWNEISMDLYDLPDLFSQCEEWYKDGPYKIDIGQFEGLWPVQCNSKTMIVNFLSDTVKPGTKNWKDWFIQGEEYAPQ